MSTNANPSRDDRDQWHARILRALEELQGDERAPDSKRWANADDERRDG